MVYDVNAYGESPEILDRRSFWWESTEISMWVFILVGVYRDFELAFIFAGVYGDFDINLGWCLSNPASSYGVNRLDLQHAVGEIRGL